MTDRATHTRSRARTAGDDTEFARESARAERAAPELSVLQVPVGTNLADVERWMIFATLQKCGGNKTRAAALLGVSLKTLYNRLNAYRAQGLAMDYGLSDGQDVDHHRHCRAATSVKLMTRGTTDVESNRSWLLGKTRAGTRFSRCRRRFA